METLGHKKLSDSDFNTAMAGLDADGSGVEIQLGNLGANNEISFVNWSPDMFMDMCILSGCDYTPSIPGLGMKTAHSIVREHRTPNRILGALQSSKKFTMPEDFVDCFWPASSFPTFQEAFQ